MALVQCPNCKIQVTEVSATCFSCGYPLPRAVVVAPPKQRKGLTRAYLAGSAVVVAAYAMHYNEWIGDGAEQFLIGIGVLAVVASLVARAFMRWMDKAS